jgi:hypothetical protein
MRDTNEKYTEIWKGIGGGIIIIALLLWFILASGCKTDRNLKKSTNDSISVVKTNEGSSKVDSSGSKSDKTNTKETVYYPQPIYIQGKDGEPKVIFVPQTVKETGTEKTEQVQVVKDESWREAFDSLSSKILTLSQDKKVKVGPSLIEWILIIGIGLIFLKQFIPYKFSITKN